MLKSLGHIIEEATNDRAAVRLMERNNIDLVLAGVDPLDGEALELLTYVRRKHREVPVILLFPRLHPERAKEALRLGAMAVLKYPVPGGRAAGRRVASPRAVRSAAGRTGEPASPAAAADPRPRRRPLTAPVLDGAGHRPRRARRRFGQPPPHQPLMAGRAAVTILRPRPAPHPARRAASPASSA